MKTKSTKENIIAVSAIILLVMSVIGTGVYYNSNNFLNKSLHDEKLKSELILSEKLSLQKEIEKFQSDINSLKGKNEELDKLLYVTSSKLTEKENRIENLNKDNSSLQNIRKQLKELNRLKLEFEEKYLGMERTVANLNKEKENLNLLLVSAQQENKQLATNLEILSSMTADNYLIEPTMRKGKLTAQARRTKKISVNFKVPENMVESISLKITKPDGKQISGNESGLSYTASNDDENYFASLSKTEIKVNKKIEMTYEPKEKLKAGIYKIEMYNANIYIGACNVKLR